MSRQAVFADTLSRFVFERGAVRGAVVSLDECCREILACQAYPPPLARVIGELLVAAALLAASLKFRGSIAVQLQGSGPVRLLVVECDARLALRATAQWSAAIHALAPDADLAEMAGGPGCGRLVITLDPGDGSPLYQGIVSLEAASVAAGIVHYLETSEHIESRMIVTADSGRVRGLLVQRLPDRSDADESLWRRVAERAGAGAAPHLVHAGSAADVLTSLFPEDDLRLFDPQAARFGCRCSRERVADALRLVGREEVESILAEQQRVSVTCEFCNRSYTLSPDEARALFPAEGSPPSGTPAAMRH